MKPVLILFFALSVFQINAQWEASLGYGFANHNHIATSGKVSRFDMMCLRPSKWAFKVGADFDVYYKEESFGLKRDEYLVWLTSAKQFNLGTSYFFSNHSKFRGSIDWTVSFRNQKTNYAPDYKVYEYGSANSLYINFHNDWQKNPYEHFSISSGVGLSFYYQLNELVELKAVVNTQLNPLMHRQDYLSLGLNKRLHDLSFNVDTTNRLNYGEWGVLSGPAQFSDGDLTGLYSSFFYRFNTEKRDSMVFDVSFFRLSQPYSDDYYTLFQVVGNQIGFALAFDLIRTKKICLTFLPKVSIAQRYSNDPFFFSILYNPTFQDDESTSIDYLVSQRYDESRKRKLLEAWGCELNVRYRIKESDWFVNAKLIGQYDRYHGLFFGAPIGVSKAF